MNNNADFQELESQEDFVFEASTAKLIENKKASFEENTESKDFRHKVKNKNSMTTANSDMLKKRTKNSEDKG